MEKKGNAAKQLPSLGLAEWYALHETFVEAGFTDVHVMYLRHRPSEVQVLRQLLDQRIDGFERASHRAPSLRSAVRSTLTPWFQLAPSSCSVSDLLRICGARGIDISPDAKRLLALTTPAAHLEQGPFFVLLTPRELWDKPGRPTSKKIFDEEFLCGWSEANLDGAQRVELCGPLDALHLVCANEDYFSPIRRAIRVGMKPMRSGNHDEVFQIQKFGDVLSLQSVFAGTTNHLAPDSPIIFRITQPGT